MHDCMAGYLKVLVKMSSIEHDLFRSATEQPDENYVY